jgi:hypothetical protein
MDAIMNALIITMGLTDATIEIMGPAVRPSHPVSTKLNTNPNPLFALMFNITRIAI